LVKYIRINLLIYCNVFIRKEKYMKQKEEINLLKLKQKTKTKL